MRNKTPRIAIVTGANRGLGKEVSRQLAAQGDIVIVTARQLSDAQQAVKELGWDNLLAAQLDITDEGSITHLVERVKQRFSVVDVLINNAAIHYDTWQNVTNADLTTVKEAMDTNVFGAWRMTQALLPLLQSSQQARIVNISSGAGALDNQTGSTPAYSMSKIALNSLTLMFANQLKSRGILVNSVCPGWVATDMGGNGGRPIAIGAEGIVWAANLPVNGPTGGFFRDRERIVF
ncbi:short-chain dehydrogenase/reductase SDR [Vibrio mediterranei AK1]|jgi:NAD(P)-dependent dehydrogenase (short-subunit alcohol dehydrogenase family)|uniref:SDR family NAD(P)-dependent oxidoreductase n=1 Tax=Vibrio mediterranei TaxID=689 RepID=UPI00015417B5|nr:SDR family NAD(P)-dependent oxidoreductase [Vibrio mediterranei]EDL54360.1 short-chain dehydrogenase/reductase SDR [Vibrio mediterranei AK1]